MGALRYCEQYVCGEAAYCNDLVYEPVSKPHFYGRLFVDDISLLEEEAVGGAGAFGYYFRGLSLSYAVGGKGTLHTALFCDDASDGGRRAG